MATVRLISYQDRGVLGYPGITGETCRFLAGMPRSQIGHVSKA